MTQTQLWQRLRAARKFADLKQADAAKACGISRSAIAQWESSQASYRTKPDSHEQFNTLAKLYGVSVEWLMSDASKVEDLYRAPPAPLPPAPTGSFKAAVKSLAELEGSKTDTFDVAFDYGGLRFQADAIFPHTIVEFKERSLGNVEATVGKMLAIETLIGTPLDKIILVYRPESEDAPRFPGLRVVPVQSIEQAFRFLETL